MVWSIQTRTITFSSEALPEIIGKGYRGKEFREPLLTARSVRGREAVGELFEYTVLAVVENPDFLANPADAAQIELENVVGEIGTIAIEVTGIGTFRAGQPGETGYANIGADTRYINGQIASARVICVEDRAAVYEFVLRPSVWTATQNTDSRIFKGQVTDILSTLLSEYGTMDWRIAGPYGGRRAYPSREFIRQAWESDWSLAMRLMEEWGLFFWFEHRKDGHSLVISDTLGGFHPHGKAYETLRHHTGARIDEEHISELSVTYTMTAGKVTVNDHDYLHPRLRNSHVALREAYEDASGTARSHIELYAPAEIAQPGAESKLSSGENHMHEEARHLARVKLQAVRCAGLRAHGKGHLRGLQAGRTFDLINYPQEKANREYIVLVSELKITDVGGSSGSSRHYSVDTSFELLPATEYYRLPQVTPRPHVDDEYAVIVTPEHDDDKHYEMWIDQHNRVRIQYDWDRQARFDGATSIWLRVASQWQGSQMGMVSPGRAGQMVIVSHIHGDPDRPYVSAFVVDKFNPPPWKLPHNGALSGIRSHGLGKSYGSNHVVLDDTDGQMQAQLASDHGKSSLTLGFNTRIDGNEGRQDARGEGFELRTDAHGVMRAAKGMLVTTETRANAAGRALDMGEVAARLTQARDIHERMAQLAQHHGAQNATSLQSDVAKSIKTANEAIRGVSKGDGHSGKFPELGEPHLVLASPAGIHSTTSGSTHLASGDDLAVTTGRNVSIASARSLFASVVDTFALFVQKAGISLTAAAGKLRLEAQRDGVQIVARKDAEIMSADGWINLTGAKGIRLNGGGTMLEITPAGLIGFTNGQFLVHAAAHGTDAPLDKPVKMPLTNIESAMVAEPFVLVDPVSGFGIPDQPYRITLDDGQVITGRSNDKGATMLVLSESMQPAILEILHNDGTESPSSILTAMLTQPADMRMPDVMARKKPLKTKLSGRELESQDNGTSDTGHSIYFAICQTYNWGMRYSTRDTNDPKRLTFPVAEAFAKSLHDILIEELQWGDNYFGKSKVKYILKPSMVGKIATISRDDLTRLADVFLSVVIDALGSSKSSAFVLPQKAMPIVVLTNKPLLGDAKGVFDPLKWWLMINTQTFSTLFAPCALDNQADRNRYARKALKEVVDTLYHETRHCQQHYWIFAMAQQRPADFDQTPNIVEWPKALVSSEPSESLLAPVVTLAATQRLPDDQANLLTIKQMAVGMYAWHLYQFQSVQSYPRYASDERPLQKEYDLAKKQAEQLLIHAGPDQTAVDVDDLAQNKTAMGYYAKPWEDDAFYCGEIAGSYWIDDHAPDGLLPNQCSRQYAAAYNSRRLNATGNTTGNGNASGATVSPSRTSNGGQSDAS